MHHLLTLRARYAGTIQDVAAGIAIALFLVPWIIFCA